MSGLRSVSSPAEPNICPGTASAGLKTGSMWIGTDVADSLFPIMTFVALGVQHSPANRGNSSHWPSVNAAGRRGSPSLGLQG